MCEVGFAATANFLADRHGTGRGSTMRPASASTGPLLDLERHFVGHADTIERWLDDQWRPHTPPFYASVDLRNSGFKLAPVDTNLFPGGWNNLDAALHPLCVQAALLAIERHCPDARNLLLIPENHTRNQYYLQNVLQLATILRRSGLEVRIGSLQPEITAPTTVLLDNGQTLVLEPLLRLGRGGRLGLEDFHPDAILLNNDLSAGIPDSLAELRDQALIPPLHAGWTTRRKSNHFGAFKDVANRFAAAIGIDPWLINPDFAVCGNVNFQERLGEECLAANVDMVLSSVRAKYREYGIDARPFVIVKANAGTYGMGVMTIRDAAEVKGLNRKQRNKMAVVKEGLPVTEVIIQEGVHTIETVGGGVAEPVIYLIDRHVVGGFYRVHAGRGRDENLNAPGMHFQPLSFGQPHAMPDSRCGSDAALDRFFTYGTVAQLALLAASRELQHSAPPEDRAPPLRTQDAASAHCLAGC
jgi:glutamate--cysteine ligase